MVPDATDSAPSVGHARNLCTARAERYRTLALGSHCLLNTFWFTFRQSSFAEVMLHGDAMQKRNVLRNILRRVPAAGAWYS